MTHVDLDDLGNAGTGGGQDSLDVVAADLGLVADVALNQVGGGISGDLAGDEDLAIGADGLGPRDVSACLLGVLGIAVFVKCGAEARGVLGRFWESERT